MTISQLLDQRRVKKAKVDLAQISEWLRRSRQDARLAKKVFDEDLQWALTITYQAMMRAGRALMFSRGYLPRSVGGYKTVVDYCGVVMRKDLQSLVKSFERLRRKRNNFFYGELIGVSKSEARVAINDAYRFIREITNILNRKHKQLRLTK